MCAHCAHIGRMANQVPTNLSLDENVVGHAKIHVSTLRRESLSSLVEKLLVKHLRSKGINPDAAPKKITK